MTCSAERHRRLTRREILLAAGGVALAAGVRAQSERPATVPPSLDHLILGVADLDAGIAWVAERTGVRAVPGGVHPGQGTRNALLALGPRRYLEIMAPDPLQPPNDDTRALRQLAEPRLLGWASHVADLAAVAERLRHAKIAFDGPTAGSRRRPDGRLLGWQVVSLRDDLDGVLPFFIEWSEGSPHPADDAPPGLELTQLVAATPGYLAAAAQVQALDLGLRVEQAVSLRLRATLRQGAREVAL